jgi:hypothetical protein
MYGYTVDNDGKVELIPNQRKNDYGGDKYDVLFNKSKFETGNKNYNETGSGNNGLIVKNTKILSDLSKIDKNGNSISKGNLSGSIDDVFKVFKFGADNTNVEWGVARYQYSKYAVYTSHMSDEIAVPDNDMNLPNVYAFIHNHPSSYKREWEERASMGDVFRSDIKKHQRFSGTDWWSKKYAPFNFEFYAYFSQTDTKRLYHIGKNKITKISNIKTFRDFYFGVLNHR